MLLIVFLVGAAVQAQESPEAAKINYLLSSVEALQGATFIRNGSEYDAKSASSHLRLKLKRAGDRVKTADDFIRLCASRSSMSGEPYLIRLPDGATVTSEAYFRDKLKTFPADKKQ
jgi:hypothetical protein